MADRDKLSKLITELAVVHQRVVLNSGQEADYYIDLRRATLHHEAAPLIGQAMLDLTADWDYVAAGGLTLGSDPVATAMLHAASARGQNLDAFVVRKAEKVHGLQRLIEGPDIVGKRVLLLEDTSTTGQSVLTAAKAAQNAGADIVGVAVVVNRGAATAVQAAGFEYRAVFELADLGLG